MPITDHATLPITDPVTAGPMHFPTMVCRIAAHPLSTVFLLALLVRLINLAFLTGQRILLCGDGCVRLLETRRRAGETRELLVDAVGGDRSHAALSAAARRHPAHFRRRSPDGGDPAGRHRRRNLRAHRRARRPDLAAGRIDRRHSGRALGHAHRVQHPNPDRDGVPLLLHPDAARRRAVPSSSDERSRHYRRPRRRDRFGHPARRRTPAGGGGAARPGHRADAAARVRRGAGRGAAVRCRRCRADRSGAAAQRHPLRKLQPDDANRPSPRRLDRPAGDPARRRDALSKHGRPHGGPLRTACAGHFVRTAQARMQRRA